MMNKSVIKGADPEVFLVINGTSRFISGVGLIGGSKEEPLPIGEGCAIQEDNVAAEFCIPPAATADAFVASIQYNLKHLTEKVREYGLELAIVPSAVFEADELLSPGAQEFGCEPDFNAWLDGEMNPRPKADNAALRSAGGHIHVSLSNELKPRDLEVIKAMDLFIGAQMLKFDDDKDRRKLYGKAGAFRRKKYGIEYRTPSNAWIKTEERIRWVWDQTDKAVAFVENGGVITDVQGEMLQKCINESDMGLLEQLNREFGLE